jgi:hypothetical protein
MQYCTDLVKAQAKSCQKQLRKMGFKRGRCFKDCVIYSKTYRSREIIVQFWSDGYHRVSHWLNNRMSTTPTEFVGVVTMLQSIIVELTRTDHKPK